VAPESTLRRPRLQRPRRARGALHRSRQGVALRRPSRQARQAPPRARPRAPLPRRAPPLAPRGNRAPVQLSKPARPAVAPPVAPGPASPAAPSRRRRRLAPEEAAQGRARRATLLEDRWAESAAVHRRSPRRFALRQGLPRSAHPPSRRGAGLLLTTRSPIAAARPPPATLGLPVSRLLAALQLPPPQPRQLPGRRRQPRKGRVHRGACPRRPAGGPRASPRSSTRSTRATPAGLPRRLLHRIQAPPPRPRLPSAQPPRPVEAATTGARPPVAPGEAYQSPSPLSRTPRALPAPTTRGARVALVHPVPAHLHHGPPQTAPRHRMTPGLHTGGLPIRVATALTTRAARGAVATRSRREKIAAGRRGAAPVTGRRAVRPRPRATTPVACLPVPRLVSAGVQRTMRPPPRPPSLRRPHTRQAGEAALRAVPPAVRHLRRSPRPRRPRRRRPGRARASPPLQRRHRCLLRRQRALRQPARPARRGPIRPRVPRRVPRSGRARIRTFARLRLRLRLVAPALQRSRRRLRRPWRRRRASSRCPRPWRPLTSVRRS
jgi:hypothetical protein